MRTHTNRRTWSAPIVSKVQQTRSQVLRFEGAKCIFREQDYCVYFMFETNFSGRNKILGAQKICGGIAQTFPVARGLKCWLPNCISFDVFDRCFCKVETRACETLRISAEAFREPRGDDYAQGLAFI